MYFTSSISKTCNILVFLLKLNLNALDADSRYEIAMHSKSGKVLRHFLYAAEM